MRIAQKLAVGAAGLAGIGLGSLGLGAAYASTPTTPPVPALGASHSGVDTKAPVAGHESDGPGGHQDPPGANVQSGSQSGPDTGGVDTAGVGTAGVGTAGPGA